MSKYFFYETFSVQTQLSDDKILESIQNLTEKTNYFRAKTIKPFMGKVDKKNKRFKIHKNFPYLMTRHNKSEIVVIGKVNRGTLYVLIRPDMFGCIVLILAFTFLLGFGFYAIWDSIQRGKMEWFAPVFSFFSAIFVYVLVFFEFKKRIKHAKGWLNDSLGWTIRFN